MKHLKIYYLPTVLVLLFAAFISPEFEAKWTLKKEKNGVSIYTRPVEGSPLKEFKGIVNIRTSPEAAKALLLDLPTYTKWQHNCIKSSLLQKNSADDIVGISLTDAPWPVQDREAIVRTKVVEENGSIILNMTATPDFTKPTSGVVRVPKMTGFWKITSKGDGAIEVLQQVHASPGGRIPDWLANSAVVDTPYNTLLNMKLRLEK